MVQVILNETERSQVLAALSDREFKLKIRIAEHRREPITESRDAAIEQNETALVYTQTAYIAVAESEPWQDHPDQMTWSAA